MFAFKGIVYTGASVYLYTHPHSRIPAYTFDFITRKGIENNIPVFPYPDTEQLHFGSEWKITLNIKFLTMNTY